MYIYDKTYNIKLSVKRVFIISAIDIKFVLNIEKIICDVYIVEKKYESISLCI